MMADRKPKNRRRTARLFITLPHADFEALRRLSDATGQPVADLVREMIAKGLRDGGGGAP